MASAQAAEGGSAVGRLAAALRDIRELAGLSLRMLERHTHVSDSSLSRYLAGRALPPWPVVEAMCRLAERDPQSLRPEWEAAKKELSTSAGRCSADDAKEQNQYTAPSEPAAGMLGLPRARAAFIFSLGLAVGAIGSAVVGQMLESAPVTAGADLAADAPSQDDGYAQVSLFTAGADDSLALLWSKTIPCASVAGYRHVVALPEHTSDKATAYLVAHSDCTVKLFQGAGGRGYGEELTSDGRSHVLSTHTSQRAMAVVTYRAAAG